MCGIGGIFSFNGIDPSIPKELKRIGKLISHRGPDDEGFVLFSEHKTESFYSQDSAKDLEGFPFSPKSHIDTAQNFFFGGFLHRRLSILDLSAAGHQPMSNVAEDLWITYNGEIYNYVEIKEELKRKGHAFLTRTDTEVILKSYEEWGVECLGKFNGMFSFTLFDRKKNKLFAARDRFGVKPYYYYKNKDWFIFSSEQKGIRFHPSVETGINEKAAFDFLAFSKSEKEPEGLFKNIFELPPSYFLCLDFTTKKIETKKYYELKINEEIEKFDSKKSQRHIEEIKSLFIDAVKIRTRSDVEVGSCLSGGIDSSSIVRILQDEAGLNEKKIHVYTAVFPNEAIDESKYAAEVANSNQTIWHKIEVGANQLMSSLEDLIYSQDIPIWSSSTFAQYSVMKEVKKSGIKVVLDGQGGDELFAGYTPYFIPYWKEVFQSSGIIGLKNEWINFTGIPSSAGYFGKESLKNLFKNSPISDYLLSSNHVRYLNDDFRKQNKRRKDEDIPFPSLNSMLGHEFYNDRLKVYLKCEDRCAMWHSVESRTPFADDLPLIEKVFSIPGIYKMQNGTSKFLLREAMKGILPENIRLRKDKMGYVTPHNKWLYNSADTLIDLFSGNSTDFIDEKKIKNELLDLKKNFNKWSENNRIKENTAIFKSISFLIWKKKFKL